MSIIRVIKKYNPFVQIDKGCLEDDRLTWQAKGLLAYLLSRPDDWQVNVKHLAKQSKNGRDATYTIINELISFKYIHRSATPTRDKSGHLQPYLYTVYETPYEEPYTDFPDTVEPDTDSQEHNNNDSNKKEFKDIDDDESLGKLNTLYSNNIHLITPLVADYIADAVEDYSYDYVYDAIIRAHDTGARSWKYIERVLENMKKNGKDWMPKKSTGNVEADLDAWAAKKNKELENETRRI